MRVSELFDQTDYALLEHQIEQALLEAGFLNKLKGLALAGLAAASMLGAAGDAKASADGAQDNKAAAVAKADAATSKFGEAAPKWQAFHSETDKFKIGMEGGRLEFMYDSANILKPAPEAVGLVLKNRVYVQTTTKTGGDRLVSDGGHTEALFIFHTKAKKFAEVTGGKLQWKDVPASGPFAEAFKVAQKLANS
jgi:hypothetical protein